ncbi:MAG: methyltransferase domain-containing protein [Ignavibacteriota bacterium]
MRRERFSSRPCPVCRGEKKKLLYRQNFEQLSEARFLDGYDVVVCEDCGAAFADDIPAQETFDRYYRDLSKYNNRERGGQAVPAEEEKCDQTIDLVARFAERRDVRILDVGSGSGQFLASLRKRGFRNVSGIDPSPACARASAELYGVEVTVGTIASMAPPAVPYDFLVLIGVMEHIRDLDNAVSQIRGLLCDGGRVYLDVPDAGRFTADADAPFQEFSTEHINFFSTRSLSNLMCLRGFTEIATGHAVRPANEAIGMAAYGAFEKSSAEPAMVFDSESEPSIRKYVEDCQSVDAGVRAKIDGALSPGERMVVWGVGTHTLRLLATGGLNPERVSLFVDSNPNYQRQQLRGVPVVSPTELHTQEPILISSRGFQREIQNQVRQQLGLDNRLILLYE